MPGCGKQALKRLCEPSGNTGNKNSSNFTNKNYTQLGGYCDSYYFLRTIEKVICMADITREDSHHITGLLPLIRFK